MQNTTYTREQVDAVNDFICAVLKLIVTWLQKLPKLMPLVSNC